MWKVCGEDKPSLLTKIFGIFEIQNTLKVSSYYIGMENLFLNIEPNVKVYDLKGSELNRFVIPQEGVIQTLLDTNFKLDRNSQPLPIKSKSYKILEQALKNDSDFLCNMNVMDYSLLLIYDEESDVLKMGIIDYLRMYDLEKQIEHMGKKIMKGVNPTITKPEDYKERFLNAMSKLFYAGSL